jgi:hypothetical protein
MATEGSKLKLKLRMADDPVPIGTEAPAPVVKAEPRAQVGARIPQLLYRELKSQAALQGRPVQDLVEESIDAYLKTQRT